MRRERTLAAQKPWSREDIPVLMIHRDLGCTSEIGDLMFLELRADADIRLLLRRLGVPDHVRVG